MAEAIKRNACLQSFVFDVRDTQIDNQAGIALAEAISPSVLQSFTFAAGVCKSAQHSHSKYHDLAQVNGSLSENGCVDLRVLQDEGPGFQGTKSPGSQGTKPQGFQGEPPQK